MLEGVDAVDWPRLTYAYGSAANVPDMLRDLASTDRGTAEAGLQAVLDALFHQGGGLPGHGPGHPVPGRARAARVAPAR